MSHKHGDDGQTPEAGKWIEWAGGECPVEPSAHVDWKLRKGMVFFAADWKHWTADRLDWTHNGEGCDPHGSDIIAYRVVSK